VEMIEAWRAIPSILAPATASWTTSSETLVQQQQAPLAGCILVREVDLPQMMVLTTFLHGGHLRYLPALRTHIVHTTGVTALKHFNFLIVEYTALPIETMRVSQGLRTEHLRSSAPRALPPTVLETVPGGGFRATLLSVQANPHGTLYWQRAAVVRTTPATFCSQSCGVIHPPATLLAVVVNKSPY